MPENFDSDIEASLDTLRRGGLILYPTDTVWGIGCDATDAQAVERIFRLKQRPDHKAMIVLVAEERDVLQYVAGPDPRVFDYLQQSVRPTTVIYEGAIGLAGNLTGADGSIAIRICRDAFCRHLIKRLRRPLVSTSANLSGMPAPAGFAAISEEIKQGVDYVVQYRQENTSIAAPSAVIRWSREGEVIVIRP
ncbi:MAG: L-threonylcarbamoyladenylate synthase [Chitinophagaceae bacterium]